MIKTKSSRVSAYASALQVLCVCALLAGIVPARAGDGAFGYQQVVAKARKLAGDAFEPPQQVPKFLRNLDQSTWQKLRYRPDKALWRGKKLPFTAQFYHPGYNYAHAVGINIVNQYGVGKLAFEKKRFIYPHPEIRDKVPDDLGYAGLKLFHALNGHPFKDEIASFLGASYFRAVGAGQHFGLSARGLAVDTGLSGGEEFPYFKTFWLEQPAQDAKSLTVYALLDSASVTGAYRFTITPGTSTTMDVEATLFARQGIAKLGIAPLTSMFMFGEEHRRHFDDYHPELHDSGGLSIHTASGEWLWRPLINPRTLTINSFEGGSPKGFGLMQRDRDFSHYEDFGARYEQRPSLWVMPQGNWGAGHVELVQIPSESGKNDNIVAYWVPKKPVESGATLHFAYRLSWQMQQPSRPDDGFVVATRVAAGHHAHKQPGRVRKVLIDFAGKGLSKLPAGADVRAQVNVMGNEGKLLAASSEKNPVTGGWRIIAQVLQPDDHKSLEMRAYLKDAKGGALSETWSYALQP